MEHDRKGDILQTCQPSFSGVAPGRFLAHQGIPDFTSGPAAVTRSEAVIPAGKVWPVWVSVSGYGFSVPADHPIEETRFPDLINPKHSKRPIIAAHITA